MDSIKKAILQSLQLLSRRDRGTFIRVTILQMLVSILDLVGVLIFGLMAAVAASAVSSQPVPGAGGELLSSLQLTGDSSPSLIISLLFAAGIILVSKSAFSVVLSRRVFRFLATRQAVVSSRLAEALLSQPLLSVQKRSSQETVYALTTGANSATNGILGQTSIALSESSLLIFLGLGLLALDPVVTIFALIYFTVIALILHRLMSGWASKLGALSYSAEVASTQSVQEAIRAYREITVANRRGTYINQFMSQRQVAAMSQANLSFMSIVPKYLFEIALLVGGALLAYTQFLQKDALGAVATIAIFLMAGSRVVPSMLRFQSAGLAIRSSAGMAQPTFDLAWELFPDGMQDLPEEFKVPEVRMSLEHKGFNADVSIENVSVKYPGGDIMALSDVTLFVPRGSSLAIVGPTGAGKSSLTDVLLGVLKPDTGQVFLGGVSPLIASQKWTGALCYVPQNVAIVSGSVRANVALAVPPHLVDDDAVWEALSLAHIADYLKDSRHGLDTVVGEHGVRLSGGQRQRLGIARALYTRPSLLVMDEATSALDAETEDLLTSTMQKLAGQITTVTIAHRLATIRRSNQVAYLEEGKLLATGSFEEVRVAIPNFDRQANLLGL